MNKYETLCVHIWLVHVLCKSQQWRRSHIGRQSSVVCLVLFLCILLAWVIFFIFGPFYCLSLSHFSHCLYSVDLGPWMQACRRKMSLPKPTCTLSMVFSMHRSTFSKRLYLLSRPKVQFVKRYLAAEVQTFDKSDPGVQHAHCTVYHLAYVSAYI